MGDFTIRDNWGFLENCEKHISPFFRIFSCFIILLSLQNSVLCVLFGSEGGKVESPPLSALKELALHT